MIRAAIASDVPRLVEMGRRFRAETGYAKHLAENPAKMAELAQQLADAGCLLVSERDDQIVGMIGFIVYPHFLSGETTGGEVFWWVEPEHRGEGVKLLREAERVARTAGAKTMQMIAPTDRVATLYQRLGYEFVEASYQRAL
jgi:GNAT superfamily N-acetyltransferase